MVERLKSGRTQIHSIELVDFAPYLPTPSEVRILWNTFQATDPKAPKTLQRATYLDRTIIIIFGKQINAIKIKSIDVANSFIEYFNLLWKTASN